MPPASPVRTVRIPDDVWGMAVERATSEGRTVTDVIRAALWRYTAPVRKQSA